MSLRSKLLVVVTTLAVSASGVMLVKHHEGRPASGYRDPVGIVTACYGHTATAVLGKKYSDAECEALLRADLKVTEGAIKRLVKVPISQEQYDALVSFVFNVGPTAFANSTLLAKLNAGDCWGAAYEFSRWNKAKGRVLPGLTSRRAEERAKFSSACQAQVKETHQCALLAPKPKDPLPANWRDVWSLRRELA